MIDYQAQLEKLRRDAAECALIADLATSPQKRETVREARRAFGRASDRRGARNDGGKRERFRDQWRPRALASGVLPTATATLC